MHNRPVASFRTIPDIVVACQVAEVCWREQMNRPSGAENSGKYPYQRVTHIIQSRLQIFVAVG